MKTPRDPNPNSSLSIANLISESVYRLVVLVERMIWWLGKNVIHPGRLLWWMLRW